MDQEKAYIEVTEFLCTELKRIKVQSDLYKGMWEHAEEELRNSAPIRLLIAGE